MATYWSTTLCTFVCSFTVMLTVILINDYYTTKRLHSSKREHHQYLWSDWTFRGALYACIGLWAVSFTLIMMLIR
jgi:purine-cytosine permease-like protein